MARLEELTPNSVLRGITPEGLATVVAVNWFGSDALELTYKDPKGRIGNRLIYPADPVGESIAQGGLDSALPTRGAPAGANLTRPPAPQADVCRRLAGCLR